MSERTAVEVSVPSLRPIGTAVRNLQGELNEVVELRKHDLWRLKGDNRWRVITCVRGQVWVTQERDLHDYVLTAGDIFIVTQRGQLLVQALRDASIEVTPSLKTAPYVGDYRVFQ